jgi:predicted GNAT family N-acyltransferase
MASCWRAFGDEQQRGADRDGGRSSGRLMTALAYRVRRAAGADELAAALELRHEVFCVEQGVPEREERDGRDHQGVHLVAFGHGELLGTCRLVFVSSTVQLSRLAVRGDVRRRGIATALLAAADRETRLGGANRLVLHAQTYALPLYEAAGYRVRGRVLVEADIEHVAMEKRL